jgi:hypothetical protein
LESGILSSTPFRAGPVTILNGLWQEAQFAWNNCNPSCAATLFPTDITTTNKNERRIFRAIGLWSIILIEYDEIMWKNFLSWVQK